MKKILITQWVPNECLEPYQGEFSITCPKEENTSFTYDEVKAMVADYDALFVIINKGDKAMIDAGKNLKVIANFGVGYDNIDWRYATEIGLPVVNTPTTVTEPTAELAITIMLSVMRGTNRMDAELRETKMCKLVAFSKDVTSAFGKTVGIAGFGRIGKALCKKAQGLGMNVIYYDPFRASPETEKEYGVTYMELDDMLKSADVVSLHLPFTEETRHLINKDKLALMKDSAYLINAARGPIVKEADLVEALKTGVIKGAGIDVFEFEPAVGAELCALDNVVITPHIGTLAYDVRVNMAKEALNGITGVLRGEVPYNVVNKEVIK